MKTAIIALSAAVLFAAAPAVLAQNASSKSRHRHLISRMHSRTGPALHAMRTTRLKADGPRAFGSAPSEPKDYTLENSRQAGGGGGGSM